MRIIQTVFLASALLSSACVNEHIEPIHDGENAVLDFQNESTVVAGDTTGGLVRVFHRATGWNRCINLTGEGCSTYRGYDTLDLLDAKCDDDACSVAEIRADDQTAGFELTLVATQAGQTTLHVTVTRHDTGERLEDTWPVEVTVR